MFPFSKALFSFSFPYAGNKLQKLRLFCSFLLFRKKNITLDFAPRLLDKNFEEQLCCEMKILHGFDAPLNVCLDCVSTTTVDRKAQWHTRERVAQHHRLYSLLCCLEHFFIRLPLKQQRKMN